MMNNRGKIAQSAQRCQTQPKAQQQGASSSQKKKRSSSSSSTPSKTIHCCGPSKISVTADAPVVQSKPGGIKVALDATTAATTTTEMECPKNHCAQQRKLSDGSSDSDLSRDSGCAGSSPSPKSVSSDSGSDVSDCPPTDTKLLQECLLLRDNDTETTESSWTHGRAYSPDRSPLRGGKGGDDDTGPTGTTRQHSDAGGGDGGFLGFGGGGFVGVLGTSSGAYLDSAANATGGLVMMMDETTEDLVREVEDLRSENEYLKDEVEELRCEVVEMRDMFHLEEVEQLQALQLQVERANKTCRILQYRLRKAERRSIRVAQTGHVDGELVRSLEHDIKVAKCVSVRVHNELEAVQKKTSKLEEENEALREKMEELAVSKMVLQAEMDKTRESSLKRRGVRSPNSKAERRLSQHMEDDSADLKCQLHFAKEELALMCKKLTRLVSESEGMREELARYRSAYGDVDHAHAPGGGEGRAASSALAREAEVKVHLRLVEEEAMLLSRRIVELEVENRGLRAEVSDERERGEGGGAGGGGEDEEVEGAAVDDLSPFAQRRETEDRGHGVKTLQREEEEQRLEEEEGSLQSQSEEETLAVCQITREGPVGGERDPADSRDSDVADKQESRGLCGMTTNDYETLLALRGHSCIVSSAIHVLLTSTTSRNNHHLCSSDALSSAKEVGGKAESAGFLHGPLKDTLELLQAMLLDFSGRVEKLLTAGGMSLQKDGHALDSYILSPARGGHEVQGEADTGKAASPEDLRTAEVKERAQQQSEWSLAHSHSAEPRMGLTFQILWVLHQWCEMKASGLEVKENRDKTMHVLRSLLEELGADMINDAKLPQSTMTECAVNTIIFDEGKHSEADRCFNSKGKRHRRLYAPYGSNLWEKKRNWVYVSQEAAQVDREERVRTWDHPIMALNFPELDFEQMQEDRSHTAPETTAVRVYYSPPSARRVHTAHLHNKLRNISPAPSVTSASWCTPPSSLSALCLGLSSNLSDDMKEITAGFSPGLRQPVHSASLERRRARGLEVSCSATQTHMMQPQMVSVGLQTDVSQRRRRSPARGPVLSARSTSSLERLAKPSSTSSSTSSLERQAAGRTERPKPSSTSSPKLYRRHSASSSSTYFSTSLLASSPVSTAVAASRERGSWSNGVTPSWTSSSTTNNRSGLGGGGGHNTGGTPKSDGGNSTGGSPTKPPSKAAAATGGRYGLVTEFLRRVSGRAADKPPGGPAAAGSKSSDLKHLERAPSRAPPGGQAATLHRNDSVTRIVNQRFMKQKEREDRANGQHQSHTAARGTVTRNHSSASVAAEGGSDESSSSRTLSFCFARPSRGTQRQQASPQCKHPQRHRVATSLTGTNDSCSDVEN